MSDLIARLRDMHKPRTERPASACVQCGIVWPCPTIRVVDEADAAPPVPADPDLRDRLRHVIAREIRKDWADPHGLLELGEFDDFTDAVITELTAAGLDAPADRATVLAEVLTAAEAVNARYPYGCSAAIVIAELRRMTDEAQQTEADQDPRSVCVCGHTRGEHIAISARLLCDICDPDSTDTRVCDGFREL